MSDFQPVFDDVIRSVDDVEYALDFLGKSLGSQFQRGDFHKEAKAAGYTFTPVVYSSLTNYLRTAVGRDGSRWTAIQHRDTRRWHFVRKIQ